MTEYGVRRLVAINSGNYSFANIDLTKPVHLAAPNNRGKSTLVNALQFLYIDDFTKMKFGHRSHEDSRRHYFGADCSYLVFECLTTSGIQCMLVRGLSNLRGGQFERYIYDGEYRDTDFLDGSEIRSFDSVRTCLADRHLSQVRNADLWQVLAGNVPSDGGKAIPRLNILPIRRREEYAAFRDVFVRLLSLMNVNARTLRQLIIESHAREVGERKIDVAAEYKDEFERSERSEHHLNFIRTVADEIDKGRNLRLEILSHGDKFATAAPLVWLDAMRCHRFLEADVQGLVGAAARLELEQIETREKKEGLLKEYGKREAALETAVRNWEQLQSSHQRWSAYRDFVKEMRYKAERQAADIAERAQHLEQVGRLDHDAMRSRVKELRRQLDTDRRAVEQWEHTAAAELRRAGVTDGEIAAAFHIANPSLLKLIVGETLTIKDLNITLERVRAIASRVKDNVYSDNAMEVDLLRIGDSDVTLLRDLDQMRRGIQISEQELKQQTERLNIAEDREKARVDLDSLKNEHSGLLDELSQYDQYSTAWSNRVTVEGHLNNAKQSLVDAHREILDLDKQLATQGKEQKRIEQESRTLDANRDELRSAVRELKQDAERLGLAASLMPESDQQLDDASRPKSMQRFSTSICGKLVGLTSDLRRMASCRSELKQLQIAIVNKSRQFETQQRYFNEDDAEWESLIESRESLPQLEDATAKNWDALFTMLGARFNAVVTAVSSIKTAVERLNRGLKAYQVSNLLAVQIKLEEEHDTYSAVESLSNQGSLFQDRDAIDIAKKKLRQMIDRNEQIDLESLFELRINIQQSDGTWKEAASLDEIGSTGTGMTVKAMIFIQLVRAIAGNEKFRLHFYIDGLGELDDKNLSATAAMAISKGVIPITADPRLHLEPLAHPAVTVYGLGQSPDGRFNVDSYRTYHAHRRPQQAGVGRE